MEDAPRLETVVTKGQSRCEMDDPTVARPLGEACNGRKPCIGPVVLLNHRALPHINVTAVCFELIRLTMLADFGTLVAGSMIR